jgi:hypothetical protein
MQLLTVFFSFTWESLLKATGVFPTLVSGVFILILLIVFTLFIFRSRDSSDY